MLVPPEICAYRAEIMELPFVVLYIFCHYEAISTLLISSLEDCNLTYVFPVCRQSLIKIFFGCLMGML